MNNIFSLPRFLMLFKKHTIEKGKEYLLSIATLIIILIAVLCFIAYSNNSGLTKDVQQLAFVLTFLLSGSVFTSMIFSDLSDKRKAVSYLLMPSSSTEKFLVSWMFSFLVFQLVFVVIFYLALYIVLSIGINEPIVRNEVFYLFNKKDNVYIVFTIYLLVHPTLFFGAIFFNKKHFIKTVFLLFLIGLSIIYMNKFLLSYMINAEAAPMPPFTSLRFMESEKYYNISHDSNIAIATSLVILVSALLWLSSYYRLKEKEV